MAVGAGREVLSEGQPPFCPSCCHPDCDGASTAKDPYSGNPKKRGQMCTYSGFTAAQQKLTQRCKATMFAVVQPLSRVRLSVIPWLQPSSLLCPWDFPGKNTGVVAISFSRGSSQTRDLPDLGIKLVFPAWQVGSLLLSHLGNLCLTVVAYESVSLE